MVRFGRSCRRTSFCRGSRIKLCRIPAFNYGTVFIPLQKFVFEVKPGNAVIAKGENIVYQNPRNRRESERNYTLHKIGRPERILV